MIGCETLLDGSVATMAISPESVYEFQQIHHNQCNVATNYSKSKAC